MRGLRCQTGSKSPAQQDHQQHNMPGGPGAALPESRSHLLARLRSFNEISQHQGEGSRPICIRDTKGFLFQCVHIEVRLDQVNELRSALNQELKLDQECVDLRLRGAQKQRGDGRKTVLKGWQVYVI